MAYKIDVSFRQPEEFSNNMQPQNDEFKEMQVRLSALLLSNGIAKGSHLHKVFEFAFLHGYIKAKKNIDKVPSAAIIAMRLDKSILDMKD